MKIDTLSGSFASNPIHQCLDGWFFWDETWSAQIGPFKTEAEARRELVRYCLFMERKAFVIAKYLRLRDDYLRQERLCCDLICLLLALIAAFFFLAMYAFSS